MRRVALYAAGTTLLAASGAVAVGWALAVPITEDPRPAARPSLPETAMVGRYPAESLGLVVASRDLFRFGRRPASLRYDPVLAVAPPAPGPPKPALVLAGLVSGTPMTAIVQGFPGVEGARVVRVGDVVGGLAVRGISRAEVRIVGLDTTWVLRVREP